MATDKITDSFKRLGDLWLSIHYGSMGKKHESAPLGSVWQNTCTDEPCPTFRILEQKMIEVAKNA